MNLSKIIPIAEEKYARKFPSDKYYTDFCIEEVTDNLPLTSFLFRALALEKATEKLYFTSICFESNQNDDVIPPVMDIVNNTVQISKKDIEYITTNLLYSMKRRKIYD